MRRSLRSLWLLLPAVTVLFVPLTVTGQPEAEVPSVEETAEPFTPPAGAKPLPADTDVRGTLRARAAERWYRLDLAGRGDAKSLLVDLRVEAGTEGDVDLAVFSDAGQLASSEGVTDTERCLVSIADLERVYVRAFLYGEGGDATYVLRAELSPRECIPGLGAYVDDLRPLREGEPIEDRLPGRDPGAEKSRVYLIDRAGVEATVVRVTLDIAAPDQADIDLDIVGEAGESLATSTSVGPQESCFAPVGENERLFARVYVGGESAGSSRYTLALKLSNEEPGPDVIARLNEQNVKSFGPGERALGQVGGEGDEFFAWVTGGSTVVLIPVEPGAEARLVLRNSEGWIAAEATCENGVCRAALGSPEDQFVPTGFAPGMGPFTGPYGNALVQVMAAKPCGFALCVATAEELEFDPAAAKPLAGTVSGETDGLAVFRLEAPVDAAAPTVKLQADPVYADLDLYVCAAPGLVVAKSATIGGLESASVPLAGAAPAYIVVKAPEGVSARFTLSVAGD